MAAMARPAADGSDSYMEGLSPRWANTRALDALRTLLTASKPGALHKLFDEIDSIAKPRGSGGAGGGEAGDRIVNQILTEIDGVGAKKSVFVIAATNRPDMLDSAIMRPGRLDRKLYCPMPGLDERAAILRALMRRARCDESLQTEMATRLIAARCDGFSGADLQALLSNAQLAAIHEELERVQPSASTAAPSPAPANGGTAEPLSAWQAQGVRATLDPGRPWLHAPDEWRRLVGCV